MKFNTPIFTLFIFFSLINTTVSAKNLIGLEWGANDDWRPNLVVGYKDNDNKKYDSDDSESRVYGWGTSISFGWDGIERFKVFRIEGYPYVQLELGVGYNLYENLPMVNIGAQSKQITMDVDMLFDGGYKSHLGFNSLDGY